MQKKKQNSNVLCIGKPCKKRNKIGMFYVWVKHKKIGMFLGKPCNKRNKIGMFYV